MSPEELEKLEVEKVVDARGSACPGPLLEAKKGIGTVGIDQVLEIWSGDETTKQMMDSWSKKVGHEYLGYIASEGYDRVFVRRKI